jgi:hypothetical protein
MTHPLTDGSAPGEWRDDNQERRLVSLAEKRLAEAVARIAVLEAALNKVRAYNVDIASERINYRPEDHIAVIDAALTK